MIKKSCPLKHRKPCPITGEPKCRCDGINKPISDPKPKETLRKLFTDHAVYTQRFIDAYLDDSQMTQFLQTRLLANQPEIGQYLGQFVGQAAGETVGNLLTEHIKLAAKIVAELGENSEDSVIAAAVDELLSNARNVANGIAGLSKGKLNTDQVYNEFAKHNSFVVDLAVLHKKGKYEEEIRTYDVYYTHMLMFSDLVWYGLIG